MMCSWRLKQSVVEAGILVALLGFCFAARSTNAQETDTIDKDTAAKLFPKPSYSPAAGRDFPTHVYWGDTHVHTSYSMDAGAFGARLGPKDAYIFAKGNEITTSTGQRAKLTRPLDFIAVTDHSDNMGFFPELFAGKPEMLADPTGRRWYDMINSGKGAEAAFEIIVAFSQGKFPKALEFLPGTQAIAEPGMRRLRPLKKQMNRVGSQLSSVSNGLQTPAVTICIAIFCSARTATRPAWLNLTPLKNLSVATILAISGNG